MQQFDSDLHSTEIFPGYRTGQRIYQSPNTQVFRAIHEQSHQLVILKVLRPDYQNPVELARYTHEYETLRKLDVPGVVKVYGLEPYRNALVLVLEDFGGISIKQWMRERTRGSGFVMDLSEFLELSIKLAAAIDQIQTVGIIHKNINPSNIVINPQTGELKLIDFGLATTLSREMPTLNPPQVLEGNLAYLSPEQTGRMNRTVDYRTDYYSLGVTLYELLTDRLPFESADALGLIHYHMAKVPVAPSVLNPAIPQVLSEIILKLLAKAPEDRYQSMRGLKHDLDFCWQQWQALRLVPAFELGKQDWPIHFLIPEKLYGREREIEILLAAFERVVHGSTEMMLITGFSGIGKTAIINEIHKPIVRQRGYFIKGKFDAFSRDIPYAAFVRAFRDLVGQILSESDAERQNWRSIILASLGQNGQVIIDVVPELERVIGPQPPVPKLTGSAAQNRFNFLIRKFITSFTTPKHPLVIFLDDLQWADLASLYLIELLINESQGGHLFLLGTYRDDELPSVHPLRLTLEKIKNGKAAVNSIFLEPLNIWDINQMTADTLNCSLEIASPLSRLVYQKTKGSPFFSIQFLKALYADGLITFNTDLGFWQCYLTRINVQALSEDVVEFMAIQIQKLPKETREVLQLAACMGNTFDLDMLSSIYQQPLAATVSNLQIAIQEGFVLPQNEIYQFLPDSESNWLVRSAADISPLRLNYQFVHDRVQQAAYSLIPEEQRPALHLLIGRLLQTKLPKQVLDERIFEVVGHLNAGMHLITDPLEQESLAYLNLQAGCKAKTAAAYSVAEKYLNAGIKLLPPNAWETCYGLSLSLHNNLADVANLNGNFQQVEQYSDQVLKMANTLLDRVYIYEILIQANIARYQFRTALQLGFTILGEFGINFPEAPGPADIGNLFQEVQTALAGRTVTDLQYLPVMTDLSSLAAMRILSSMGAPAYLSAPPLFPLLIARQLILSIQNGNTATSIYAYTSYGTILCGILGDIEGGYEFGQLALRLLDKLKAKEVLTRNYFQYYVFIHHWKHPITETLSPLLEGYHVGLETGDLEFACYSISHYLMNAYFTGQNLSSLAVEISFYRSAIHNHHQESPYNYCGTLLQAVLNLQNKSSNPGLLVGEAYDETKMLPLYLQTGEITALHNLYIHKLILSYLFEDYEQASYSASQSAQYLAGVPGIVAVVLHYFYDSLVKLALYQDSPPDRQATLLEQVEENQIKLQSWADKATVNYQHKFDLVEAERQRVLGNPWAALEAYERAIALSKKYGYLQEEALALELVGRFFLAWGKERIAQLYLTEAHETYKHWGAITKVEHLEQRYPRHLMKDITVQDQLPIKDNLDGGMAKGEVAGVGSLDLATVIKALQAIAMEIELSRLLKRMMRIILENAGAQRGVLLLEENGTWVIKAEGTVDNHEVEVLQGLKLQESQRVPVGLIHQVVQTRQNLVLDDAFVNDFREDPYIRQNKVRSVLCLQLINRGQLSGILYLENNLMSRVFTAERLELLNLLSTQMAISLDNALLYGNLEAEVVKRTRQLQEINQELEAFSYSVSHDLRAPLRSISGFSQALLDDYHDKMDAQGRTFLLHIQQANSQMESIIENLLQLSRVTRHEMRLETVDLSEMVKQISASFHEVQPDRMVEWVIPPGITAQADSGLLSIVLENLLNNAWKFTSKHERARIEFGSKLQDGERVYFVRDDGAGFDMTYADKLFKAFERLHKLTEFDGTGIGLTTVQRIIQKHGGRIWAEGIVEQGATFFFTLSSSG